VKVCENCFIFYINVLKHFEIDAHYNLVEKKAPSSRTRMMSEDSGRRGSGGNEATEKEMLLSRKSEMKSMKHLFSKPKEVKEVEELEVNAAVKRSASHQSRLRSLHDSPKEIKVGSKSKPKEGVSSDRKREVGERSNKLIEAKLSNAKFQLSQKESPMKKVQPVKVSKPSNY
jgi:hypothetical protein